MSWALLARWRRLAGSPWRSGLALLPLVALAAWLAGASALVPTRFADSLAWPVALAALVAFVVLAGSPPDDGVTHPSALWRRLGDALAWLTRHPTMACAISAAFLAVTCAYYGFRAYAGFRSGAYDLGIFDQVVYSLSKGHGYYSTLRGERSYLGDHFSPVLAVFAPLYLAAADPRVLIAAQAVAVALAVFPLYRLTSRLASPGAALALVALYVLSVPVRRLATADFHPESLAPLVIAWGLERLEARKHMQAALWLGAALTIKESTALAVAGTGLVVLFALRRPAAGALLTACGLGAFVALALWVIPSFAGESGFQYTVRYRSLGSSFSEILWRLVTHPWLAGRMLWPSHKIEYLLRLLAPLAFLPLLGWRWSVGAVFVWAQNTLTDYHRMHSVHFQYVAEIIPFLWAGAAAGVSRLRSAPSSDVLRIRQVALVAALGLTLALGEAPEVARALRLPNGEREARITQALAAIPPDAAVSADYNLLPHLSRREHIYLFPTLAGRAHARYVALEQGTRLRGWFAPPGEYERIAASLPERGLRLGYAYEGFELWMPEAAATAEQPP